MPESALDELEGLYDQILGGLPGPTFDSHEFILVLAQREQRLYVQALAAYADTNRPFQIVHGEIARRLQNHATLVRRVREHESRDIFGQLNSAVIWEKV